MSKAIANSNKDLDENLILGYLFFYNLGDLKIDENDLQQLFVKNGLDTRLIRKISKADAFRRATSKSKKTVDVNYGGKVTKAYLEVDEIKTDNSGILRLLGRKIVDEKNEDLSYEVIGRMEFDRSTDSSTMTSNPNFYHEYNYSDVMEEIDDRFREWSQFHTKDTVRNLTNQIIKSMYPVNLMPTGLAKFIPKTHKDTLLSLQSLIRDLGVYGAGNVFEIIPVIDTDEQRDLVTRTALDEMKKDLNEFVTELKDVITNKAIIPSRTAKSYVLKFKEIEAKAAEYEKLVGAYMPVIHQMVAQSLEFVDNHVDDEEI